MAEEYVLKELTGKIIGACIEVHKELGFGDFLADLIVENSVLVELKAVNTIRPEFESQIINYLKATGIRVGLLVNFGRSQLEWKRYIF